MPLSHRKEHSDNGRVPFFASMSEEGKLRLECVLDVVQVGHQSPDLNQFILLFIDEFVERCYETRNGIAPLWEAGRHVTQRFKHGIERFFHGERIAWRGLGLSPNFAIFPVGVCLYLGVGKADLRHQQDIVFFVVAVLGCEHTDLSVP